MWWGTATSAVIAGIWLRRGMEGGWAWRVQGEAHLMWFCSFSGLVLGDDARVLDSQGVAVSTNGIKPVKSPIQVRVYGNTVYN